MSNHTSTQARRDTQALVLMVIILIAGVIAAAGAVFNVQHGEALAYPIFFVGAVAARMTYNSVRRGR